MSSSPCESEMMNEGMETGKVPACYDRALDTLPFLFPLPVIVVSTTTLQVFIVFICFYFVCNFVVLLFCQGSPGKEVSYINRTYPVK